MITPFSGPHYRRNRERCCGEQVPCVICGQPIDDPHRPGTHSVNVVDGGAAFGHADADPNDPGFMGGFPVGPGCWRKYGRELAPFEIPMAEAK